LIIASETKHYKDRVEPRDSKELTYRDRLTKVGLIGIQELIIEMRNPNVT